MAGKGDVLRPMAVKEMTGVWPGEERDPAKHDPKPCHKCGRDVSQDETMYVQLNAYTGFAAGDPVNTSTLSYECRPKCPA